MNVFSATYRKSEQQFSRISHQNAYDVIIVHISGVATARSCQILPGTLTQNIITVTVSCNDVKRRLQIAAVVA